MGRDVTTLETGIGEFSFACERTKGCPVSLKQIVGRADVPEGMSVERLTVVLCNVPACSVESSVRFSCHYFGDAEGSPCTGEGLEAQEWSEAGRMVVVGTEDGEFLADRFRHLSAGEKEALAEYNKDSMIVHIRTIPPECNLSLHFALAENPEPEPVDASAWFAVDIPHVRVNSNGT